RPERSASRGAVPLPGTVPDQAAPLSGGRAMSGERTGTFIATKEHRRFTEFAEAVRKHRYVGLCYGAAGVGKTLSARRYAHWDVAGPYIEAWKSRRNPLRPKVNAALASARTVFHTPSVLGTLRDLRETLDEHIGRVDSCIDEHLHRHVKGCRIVDSYEPLVEM